ncbi:glycosyltransferase [Roseimaritima sediminicola]|uniref:glycosyltransferase n=1 Tax=Roseimaritima sediminicola TaxID=2662066 RepID=UPI0012983412|nr:glycosyltransferase [Roseimaritima sediminicola]
MPEKQAAEQNKLKTKILFVRTTLGQGGADRVTIQLLKHLNRDRFTAELTLMRTEGVFLGDVPQDVPVHSLNARSLWFTLRPLAKLLRENNYDVIYSTCTGSNIPLCLIKSLFRIQTSLVISERSAVNRTDSPKQWLLFRLKKSLYRHATWVTAVSAAIAQQIAAQLNVPEEQIVVVHNPLIDDALRDSKHESVEHPFFSKDRIPVILAAGRLVGVKNFKMLLKALKSVLNQIRVNLCILGEGPLLNDLIRYAEELGISDHVSFLGFDKNPYKFMSRCDIFVLSSNFEGMPGVLVQAMACGAAIISTDCPTGPNEIVTHGENGFLVPTNDSEAMARRIIQLLQNTNLRRQFQMHAPASVKRFEKEQAMRSYFNFL